MKKIITFSLLLLCAMGINAQVWHNVKLTSKLHYGNGSVDIRKSNLAVAYGLNTGKGHNFFLEFDYVNIDNVLSNVSPNLPPPTIGAYKYRTEELTLVFNWGKTIGRRKKEQTPPNDVKWSVGATTWTELRLGIDEDFQENYISIIGSPPSEGWFKTVRALHVGPALGATYVFKNGIFFEVVGALGIDLIPFIRPLDSHRVEIDLRPEVFLGYRFGWHEKKKQ